MYVVTIRGQRVYVNPAHVVSVRERISVSGQEIGSTITVVSGDEYPTNLTIAEVISNLTNPSAVRL